jgi:hypothetical protein
VFYQEKTTMAEEFNDQSEFRININNKTYNVKAYGDYTSKFKIETDCEYMFTVIMDEEGQWHCENDVTVLNENLIQQIGRAIEEHDMR